MGIVILYELQVDYEMITMMMDHSLIKKDTYLN